MGENTARGNDPDSVGGEVLRRLGAENPTLESSANEKVPDVCTHKDLILNWFRVGGTLSNGIVVGLNNKAKLTIRKAYGFQS